MSQTDTPTGLVTTYTWTGTAAQPKLASITPAGQATLTYAYDTQGRLSKVTRPVPASAGGGTAQLAATVYGHAPSAIGGLSLTQFSGYNLSRTATKAFAVFGPDAVISSAPTSTDAKWRRADLWLTDDEGYTIHEARYGAGEWQLTANVYDQSDNIIKSWDARATAEIRQPNSAYTNIDAAATITKYNSSDIKDAAGNVVVPARTRVTDVYSPASMIAPTGSEVEEMIRKRVVTTYDEGAPTVGLSLPTKVKVTAERLNGSVVETLATTFTGYEKLETYDPKSGWDLRQATSTTLDMNGNGTADSADIRRETRYDARGRVNEQRQPGANTTAPGTRRTLYYTAATHPMDAACGGQPAWAGYVCTEGPASQPAGVTLPVTRYTNYAWHGASTTQTETSGAVTRTTTTTYDAKLRPITVATAVSGLASSSAIPTVTTSYDNATGNVTGTSSTAGSTALTYDNWGRQLTYTITPVGGTAETTTTAYNALGHVASVTTPKSSSVYTYDGTDANGTAEYRGLLTKIQTTANAQTWTATAGYDAQGQLTLEKLPGKINRTTMYDLTGELVSQEYAGVTAESPSTPVPWVAWSVRANAAGQIVNEWNPEAAAHSDELPGEHAVPADIGYSYDPAGRLVRVEDRATTDGADVCTVRTYAFDKRGNRTAQTSASGAAASPGCPSTPSTTITRAYDAADRPTTGGNGSGSYVYDQLGRQLMVPSVDAPNPGGGNVALAYFHDDSAKSITQGNTVLSYALDISGRRATQTTTVSGSVTSTVVNHYTDDSDSPGWVTNAQGGSTATTVYADLVAEDLSLSLINDNSGNRGELALTTPRGDVAATITLATPSATAAGLDSWTRYTEYGAPVTAQPVGQVGAAGNGYGWLGGKQRTTTATIGLLLMGARLYNPVTGLFTSLDPVYGGNDTAYGYPNDPVNKQDTTGKAWWSTALLVASFVPGPVGLAASVVSAGVALARRDYSGAALSLLGPAGRFAKYAWRAGKAAKSAYRAVSGNRMRRAGSATRAFGRSIRATIVNGNNTLRVGRVNGNMRVSIGASRKHWGRMGTVRRQFYRASAHLERRRGFGNWHTRARTYNRRFY